MRAPSGPPLLPEYDGLGSPPVDEASSAAPAGAGDFLAANGLDSPFCRSPTDLSAEARANCAAARFAAGPYPTGNYMFDVNIDTGISKWSNDASAVVQNLTQLGWMSLVSLTHGLIVMLEWGYTLGAAGRGLISHVTDRLRVVGLGFTQPLLAVAMALAAALAAYHGLIRRRAAETVGQAIVTLAMMAIGLWLIVDPTGTVGELQQWSDEAGAGTLAVAAAGVPDRPRYTLTGGLGRIFDVVVTAPWCYMEFGDVRWCDSPRELDGRLRAAGLRIAAKLQSERGCGPFCPSGERRPVDADERSAGLLRKARTNGQIFLALPAEETQRNSAKASGSLLNVLCGKAGSASACRGPTARQAEFRSEHGTYGRVMGLLLIWVGGLGMLLLFGFLTLRLLLCGVATIGYLLLAPAAALIPALGDDGRAAFRAWATRLLAAAVSKLTYSFLLGVALTVTSLLVDMTTLGWWARWLLLSAFWWGAFSRRHQLLGVLPGRHPRPTFAEGLRLRRRGRALPSQGGLLHIALRAQSARSSRRFVDEAAETSFPMATPLPADAGGDARRGAAASDRLPGGAREPHEATFDVHAWKQAQAEADAQQARLRAEFQEAKKVAERRKSPMVDSLRALAEEWESRPDRPGPAA